MVLVDKRQYVIQSGIKFMTRVRWQVCVEQWRKERERMLRLPSCLCIFCYKYNILL